MTDYPTLRACPFCGGEAALDQTGRYELTLMCVGVQPSGLRGCGPKYVQKVLPIRQTLEWLAETMAKTWNRRAHSTSEWRPISEADKSIATVQHFGPVVLRNSYPIWARDIDGRIYEAVWTDHKNGYWWDLEAESPVDPVEFMPHPLASPAHLDQHGQGGEGCQSEPNE